jgi:hypothetical protein
LATSKKRCSCRRKRKRLPLRFNRRRGVRSCAPNAGDWPLASLVPFPLPPPLLQWANSDRPRTLRRLLHWHCESESESESRRGSPRQDFISFSTLRSLSLLVLAGVGARRAWGVSTVRETLPANAASAVLSVGAEER